MENVITLEKLIGCFFSVSPSTLSFVFENSENKRNCLARPVMGTIFLVYYYGQYVGMSVCLSYVKLSA